MSGSDRPILAQRIIYAALALLAAVMILSLAVSVLQAIWPWLLGVGLIGATVTAGVWWHRRDSGSW